ncbi:MAG TPA: hypothetical protein VHC22_24975 [Pirellulales bacterium]|nr:hypothetical protein [Pirellulales bacterium]
MLLDALMMAMHLNEPAAHTTMYSYAVVGAFEMFIGFFVMCGVPAFDRMAFPRHHKETDPSVGNETGGEGSPISR